MTPSERERKNKYANEYYHRNSKILLEKEKIRREKRIANGEPLREAHRIVNEKYYLKNKDAINKRAKDRNWNYNVETAKIKRARYSKKRPASISMTSAQGRAKRGNLAFDLTAEWYEAEFKKGCAATGLKLDANGDKTPWVAHVDRIVPKYGYVMSNCRLVCACFNLAKKHWTDDVVLKMAESLIEFNRKATK